MIDAKYRDYNLDSGAYVRSGTRQASPTSLSYLHARTFAHDGRYISFYHRASCLSILTKEW